VQKSESDFALDLYLIPSASGHLGALTEINKFLVGLIDGLKLIIST